MKDINILINNGINVNASLELFLDIAFYDETVTDFLNGVTQKLNDIDKYKESSDMANYAILVHSLKSDAKYLGLTKLAELAYNHEIASKSNDVNYVYNNYESLISETNRIISVLRNYMGEEVLEIEPLNNNLNTDKTILVVDDSDIILNFVKKIFSSEYKIEVAKDGVQALNVIGVNNKIVAMLLDLNMPNANGFEVLKYLEENNLFIKIPVTIITADDTKETIEKAFNYPITDVIQKPFNERDIKRVIDKMIELKETM